PIEWVFGASSAFKQNIDFYIGINVIANYIIGWVFTFGLFGTFLLVFTWYSIPSKLMTRSNKKLNVALIVFFLVSVTN
ncbi:hypothetical protein CWB77_18180, partial [Pseudoalteromonas sp. S1610]